MATTRTKAGQWTGTHLLTRRQGREETQAEAAAWFGVSERTYRRWENGEWPIPRTAQLMLDREVYS